MDPIITAKRKNDAVITVTQNNSESILEIEALNAAAETLTGYTEEDIVKHSLIDILPEHESDMVESYVDFEVGGNDLASVLRKTHHFHILNREKKAIPVELKVFYVVSESGDPQYELLMRDVTLLQRIDEFKEHMRATMAGGDMVDAATGLQNKALLMRGIDLVKDFIRDNPFEAIFATSYIDIYDPFLEEYGEKMTHKLVQSVGKHVKDCCRDEDIVGYMGNGVMGLLLFNCNSENAKVVLNRIRMTVNAHANPISEAEEIYTTISTGYQEVQSFEDSAVMVSKVMKTMEDAVSDGGDGIFSV